MDNPIQLPPIKGTRNGGMNETKPFHHRAQSVLMNTNSNDITMSSKFKTNHMTPIKNPANVLHPVLSKNNSQHEFERILINVESRSRLASAHRSPKLQKSGSQVSIRDMALAGSKDDQNSMAGGISGYKIPMWKHKKNPVLTIAKDQHPRFIDWVIQTKKSIPAPNQYETTSKILERSIHLPMNKSPKVTYIMEQTNVGKKSPGVGQYNADKDLLLPRQNRGGGFDRDIRIYPTDVAVLEEKEKPGHYQINLKHVQRSPHEFTIPKDTKVVRKDVEMGIAKHDKPLGP